MSRLHSKRRDSSSAQRKASVAADEDRKFLSQSSPSVLPPSSSGGAPSPTATRRRKPSAASAQPPITASAEPSAKAALLAARQLKRRPSESWPDPGQLERPSSSGEPLDYHPSEERPGFSCGGGLFSASSRNALPQFTPDEVAAHNTADDCWLIVDGKVYDVTTFVAQSLHQGGKASILKCAGQDATYHVQFHSPKMMKLLNGFYLVGRMKELDKDGGGNECVVQ